jgi:hypothetical protein
MCGMCTWQECGCETRDSDQLEIITHLSLPSQQVSSVGHQPSDKMKLAAVAFVAISVLFSFVTALALEKKECVAFPACKHRVWKH